MITSYLSSNTFFFTKSEQQALCAKLYTCFIPFRPFFIPFYTRLYINTKPITSAHRASRPVRQIKLYPPPPFLFFIPGYSITVPAKNISVAL